MDEPHYDLSPVQWAGDRIVAVDQTALPEHTLHLHLLTVDSLIDAIQSLAIRGAPALGCAGALGVVLSAHLRQLTTGKVDRAQVAADADRIARARPTAADLATGVRRALAGMDGGFTGVLAAAGRMVAEIAEANRIATETAADLVGQMCPSGPVGVATHCNTGPLATMRVGTALGVVVALHARNRVREVLVGETRPLLQGARLTTWELATAGVPHRLCVDAAMPAAMAAGIVDCVVVGADRIAANGDVANKIGTYGLAIAAARHGLPFVVVAPSTTVDRTISTGAEIVVEHRGAAEVREVRGQRIAPVSTASRSCCTGWGPACSPSSGGCGSGRPASGSTARRTPGGPLSTSWCSEGRSRSAPPRHRPCCGGATSWSSPRTCRIRTRRSSRTWTRPC
jgi:methylthioribose-1-phosphate isomerase